MIAKMQVTNLVKHSETYQELEMMPVTSKPFDQDGVSEDNSFSRWTPSGHLKLGISNPQLMDKFQIGQKFYLEFTEAKE